MQPAVIKLSRPFLTGPQLEILKRQTGMHGEGGLQKRIRGFQLAWTICRALKFPVRTFASAMLLFHRASLYTRSTDANLHVIICACIITAFKIEDTPKKCQHVAAAALKALKMPAKTKDVEDLKAWALQFEQRIYEINCFDLRVGHPHIYVVKMCHVLHTSRRVGELAWNIATDMYVTDAVLRQPAHTIALASIVLAAKLVGERIFPLDSQKFCSERSSVNECLDLLLGFYRTHFADSLLSGLPDISPANFEAIHEPIEREIILKEPGQDKPASFYGLVPRDWQVSDTGTSRYVLNWQRDHLEKEVVS